MAVTAESVIYELEARTQGYDAAINGSADKTVASMSKIERSASQAEAQIQRSAASMGSSFERAANDIDTHSARAAAATRNLGRQISDIGTGLAGGQNPFLIIAQQAPQVADALADTGGKAAKVAAFFAGPWGAALLAAGSALGVLFSKALESGHGVDDLVDKLRKQADQARLNATATDIYSHSLEGLADAAKKANEELTKQNRTQLENLQLTYSENEQRLAELTGKRADAQSALNKALRDQAGIIASRGSNIGGTVSGASQANAERAAADAVAVARKRLADATSDVAIQQGAVTQARIPVLNYEAAATDANTAAVHRQEAALIALKKAYDAARDAAYKLNDPAARRRALSAADTTYRTGVERANRSLAAAQESIRGSSSANNRQVGRQVTLAEATDIVHSIGGRVTSGLRSTAKQAQLYADYKNGTGSLAAKPGSSYHELGQALDIAKTSGVTIARIRKAFQDQGVAIRELLDEGSHYHIAFGKAGRSPEALAREAERQAKKEAKDEADFLASLRKNLLAADIPIAEPESERNSRLTRRFEGVFGKEGVDYADPFSGVDQYVREAGIENDARVDAERHAQSIREDNVRSLANLYEDLFQQGTGAVWQDFKNQGLRTLALIAAQATIASFSKGGGGVGSLIGNFGKGFASTGNTPTSSAEAIAQIVAGSFGGRASGGYVGAGQLVRVNEAGSPGNVEGFRPQGSGTVIPLGQMKAATRSASTTIVHAPQFNLKGAVVTAELYAEMREISRQSAAVAGQTAYRQSLRDAPGRVQQLQTLGN